MVNARAYAVAAEQVAYWMTQGLTDKEMYQALTGVWCSHATLDLVINMLARKWIDMQAAKRPELRMVA